MYGLRVQGFREPATVLGPADRAWPALQVAQRRPGPADRRPARRPAGTFAYDDARADIWIAEDERVAIERSSLQVEIIAGREVGDDLLAHPYLTLPAAVAGHWLGRQLVHGAAVTDGLRAWALLGTKEAGKSSLAAWFASRGTPVMNDDLLVLDGTTLFAGPRCVDLRDDAAARFGGEPLEFPGRSRRRLRLPPAPASAPLGGFVVLGWDDGSVRIDAVPAGERLQVLVENFVLAPRDQEALAYLDLASLPMYRFVRPRQIDGIDHANAQLVGVLGQA